MRKYPLQALLRVRAQKVDECQTELANKLTEVQAAEQLHEERRGALNQLRQQLTTEQGNELERAQSGQLRVEDFQQLERFADAMRVQEENMEMRVKAAASTLSAAEAARERARAELAQGKADVNLIEKHRERFQKAESDLAQAVQDEEASEVWGAKQGR